jgi:hypothetical protein
MGLLALIEGVCWMRWLAMLLLMAWMSLPALAARRVTVRELDQILIEARGKSDGRLAGRLGGLELSERLSGAELARWEAALPGEKSRQALELLADTAAFLDPPGLAGSGTSTPEMEAQLQMVTLAVQYVKSVLPRLPNFTATRETRRYREVKPVGPHGQEAMVPHAPMQAVGDAVETLLYRNGEETVDPPEMAQLGIGLAEGGLTTHGVFGPMLGIVMADAIRGRLTWGRWEQDAENPVAVFRFAVPKEKSHYQVKFCCFQMGKARNHEFRAYAAYHGEVALDPTTGTVLRLMIVADMEPQAPILKSDILVEYGPVAIGGEISHCPVRSVSLQVEWERGTGFVQTSLNDVAFSRYHMFGTESRMLTGVDGETP